MSIQPLYLAAVAGAVIGLLAAPMAMPPVAMAQTATTAAAAGTGYDGQTSAQQAALFSRQVASGELARLSDEQVLAVFHALQPDALLKWARAEMNRYPEYEYWMSRQERLNNQWQDQPARMQIRYRHQPRQLYAKWLPGGAQSGQEIIYDETRRKDEMYGHLGGVLGFTSMWIALDGTLARSQSNHTVRDLGFQFVLSMLERDARSLRAAGLSEKVQQGRDRAGAGRAHGGADLGPAGRRAAVLRQEGAADAGPEASIYPRGNRLGCRRQHGREDRVRQAGAQDLRGFGVRSGQS
ncbi:hypothetical protein AEMCBJ_19255 [Cupriavidus necator]